ncbi:MAG: hypothetical protein N2Z75_08195, partial [Meiothermus sp.]|nr:hypothetical protein [Meiothermus sp.]
FYCERGLLQALTSVKRMNTPTLYEMFRRPELSDLLPSDLNLFDLDEFRVREKMLQQTELFTVQDLQQHVQNYK